MVDAVHFEESVAAAVVDVDAFGASEVVVVQTFGETVAADVDGKPELAVVAVEASYPLRLARHHQNSAYHFLKGLMKGLY